MFLMYIFLLKTDTKVAKPRTLPQWMIDSAKLSSPSKSPSKPVSKNVGMYMYSQKIIAFELIECNYRARGKITY